MVQQNACMWKSISTLSPFLSSSFFGERLLLFLLLRVSDCTQDMLQNPLKSTEKFPESPNPRFLWFSPFTIIQYLSSACQDLSRILAFRNRKTNSNRKTGTDFKRITPVSYVLATLAYSAVLTYVKFYADSLHILILNKYVRFCTLWCNGNLHPIWPSDIVSPRNI